MTNQQKIYYATRSLNALKEVMPQQIPWELLYEHISLGERWVPLNIYKTFSEWLFGCEMRVEYLPSVDTFKVVQESYKWSQAFNETYKVVTKGRTTVLGDGLMEYALMDKTPCFTYTEWPDNISKADNDAIQLAAEKIEQIKNKWTEWLQALPEDERDELVNLYNNKYNSIVIRKFNGEHLALPGIDMGKLESEMGIKEIWPAQKAAIWRIIQDKGGIMDWTVGLGKTLICVIAAHELKRMGIRRKPAILCLKSNVGDVVKTYRAAYPIARVLAPSEQDFEKENRMRLFHEMKNTDWDCVIMTHDQFGKIPQDPEIERRIMQEEIDNLERDLKSLGEMGWKISRTMRKGLEQRKASLDVKLRVRQSSIDKSKDNTINFNEIGIDHLLIDEFHKFKNLSFTTRHNQVAGIGNQQGSQKATNMLFAIRTLQDRFGDDLQATFLSGTPISNSLSELYLLDKYLKPRKLEWQKFINFDSWVATYALKTSEFEFGVTGQIQCKERFRHYIKVPELVLGYSEIADCQTYESIEVDRPEMVEELVHLPATEDQEEFIHKLIEYARTGDGDYIGRPELQPGTPTDGARMLIACNYAKKMSTDMRLIDPDLYDEHPGNKINACCIKVNEFYRKYHDNKGTQLIFCDLGVPDKGKWNVYDEVKKKLTEVYEIPECEIAFIHSYNERTRGKLFREVNEGKIRILIGSTDKAGTGVNVQERVVAIHDLDIPWKPAELEQRGGRGARQGNWLAKLEQDNIVYRYIYAVEKSLDTYKFTILKNKQTFISQIKTNKLHIRSIDEGSFDESTGMNFAEYVAILSGDTTLLEKARVDKKLAVLENLRDAHYRERHNNKRLLENKKLGIGEMSDILEMVTRDHNLYLSNVKWEGEDEERKEVNDIRIPVLENTLNRLAIDTEIEELRWEMDKQERKLMRSLKMVIPEKMERKVLKDSMVVVGEWILEVFKSWRPKAGIEKECIGNLYGFNLYIERVTNQNGDVILGRGYVGDGNNIIFNNRLFSQHPEGGLKYIYASGVPERSNAKLAARSFLSALKRIGKILEQYQNEVDELNVRISQLQQVEDKPFSKEEELHALRHESKELEKKIKETIESRKTIETVI